MFHTKNILVLLMPQSNSMKKRKPVTIHSKNGKINSKLRGVIQAVDNTGAEAQILF